MVSYITGIYMLILYICQFNEARMVNSADFNIQRGSLTRLGKVSEEIFRNPHRLQRMTSAWLKRISPARKCKDGPCYGDSNQGGKNQKPCFENGGCENKVHRKTFKQSDPEVESPTKNDSPATLSSSLNRMLEEMVQKFPCIAGNPSCEREKAVPTKISHRCPTGLRCPKERNHHGVITNRRKLRAGSYQADANSLRTKKETTNFDGIARAARECPFGLWCLENKVSNENEIAGKNMKLENDNSHGKLICGQGFGCKESKASNDDTSTKLADIEQNKDVENCPFGLWCSTKRELGYESSSTLEKCPPGLWCKRNDIMFSEDTLTKRVNNANNGKREEAYKNFENLNHCPPGLWCKREEINREDQLKKSKIDKEFCPAGLMCSSKREVGYENSATFRRCPPGLWCKREMIVTKDDTTELVHCPNGYRCSTKRLVDYENSEILDECPPGLWCKRTVSGGGRIFKEQRSTRKKEDYCSTGPWCDLKRHVANPTRHMLDECPPGLWCKRYAGKIQAAPTEQENDD